MFPIVFPRATTVIPIVSACISIATAGPLYAGLSPKARNILARATPAAPRFVIYSDRWVTGAAPSVEDVAGYNVFALSFLLYSGSADQAQNWEELSSSERSSIKSQYDAAGISLIVSGFGSTETPTSSGVDATDAANTMAEWVKNYNVDGIDVDYEDLTAFDKGDGSAENWLITYTKQLRDQLPSDDYILTHAPLAPWFSPNTTLWGGGGYLKVHSSVGDLVDWYNVQFYNQGTDEYTTCDGLLSNSSSAWEQTALFQIADNGVTLDKLVIGKPGTSSDASNGYMAPSTLASCVSQANDKNWDAGVMVWEYPDAAASWIATVRGSTFPEPSTTSSVSSPTSTSSGSTSTPTAVGQCANVSTWDSSAVYTSGDQVTYDGHLWSAQWWTENDTPGGTSGVWTDDGAC